MSLAHTARQATSSRPLAIAVRLVWEILAAAANTGKARSRGPAGIVAKAVRCRRGNPRRGSHPCHRGHRCCNSSRRRSTDASAAGLFLRPRPPLLQQQPSPELRRQRSHPRHRGRSCCGKQLSKELRRQRSHPRQRSRYCGSSRRCGPAASVATTAAAAAVIGAPVPAGPSLRPRPHLLRQQSSELACERGPSAASVAAATNRAPTPARASSPSRPYLLRQPPRGLLHETSEPGRSPGALSQSGLSQKVSVSKKNARALALASTS